MAVTQYIGARYVPLFADPFEWDGSKAYEPLTIVQYQGNSYTSKQAVPIGIDITNAEFWALTGNYNAQVEAYRREVATFSDRIDEASETASEAASGVQTLESELAGETQARIDADASLRSDLSSEISSQVSALSQTLADDVEALEQKDSELEDKIDAAVADIDVWGTISRSELYGIVDRFIWNESHDGDFINLTDAVVPSSQGGYFFKRDGSNYGAFPMEKQSNHFIVFRNIDSNTTVGYFSPQGYSHDEALCIVGTELRYISGVDGNLYVYDITNLSGVTLKRSTASGFEGTSSFPDPTDSGYYYSYVGYSLKRTRIGSAPTDADSIIDLRDFFDAPEGIIQSLTVTPDGKYATFAHWMPNAIWVFDLETKKLKSVTHMQDWYDFVPFKELESAQILDGKMYATTHQAAEGYAIATTVAVDFENPVVHMSQDFASGSTNRYVYGTTGKLFRKARSTSNNFQFRLITDAVNAAKRQGEGVLLIMRDSGYPRDFVIENMNVTMQFQSSLQGTYEMNGGNFYSCRFVLQNPQALKAVCRKSNVNDIAWCMYFARSVVLLTATNATNAKAFTIQNNTSASKFFAFFNSYGILNAFAAKGNYCDHSTVNVLLNTSTDTNFEMANCNYRLDNTSGDGKS